MAKIAVFPIPECVTFPGTRFPLHVFEPRYRDMVEHCISKEMPLAVCHIAKTLRPAPQEQSLSEALHTNQAIYKPVTVVSAGRCELERTLNDGRMMINVALQRRYELEQEIQSLPFLIYQARPYDDEPLARDQEETAQELKEKLLHRLNALTRENPEVQSLLNSQTWQEKPVPSFSLELFNLLQTDAEEMQSILEMRSPIKRMDTALTLLRDIPAQI